MDKLGKHDISHNFPGKTLESTILLSELLDFFNSESGRGKYIIIQGQGLLKLLK